MSDVDIFKIQNEYKNIITLLRDTSIIINETVNRIDILVEESINIELIKKIGENVNYFNLDCNPFPSDYEEIIEELEQGLIDISEITSLVINLDKDLSLQKMENIHYVFFNIDSVITAIKELKINKITNKINIGVFNDFSMETELFQFIGINKETSINNTELKEIDSEIIEHINFYLSNNRGNEQSLYYNPYSFVIQNYTESANKFEQLIKNEFYNTMLSCLSDKEDLGYLVIRGEKNISILPDKNFKTNNYMKFIDIFLFLISHKKYTEKFIITKRVVTLYLKDKDTVSKLDEKLPDIWKTINHYYNHYIEDNIKDFFKTKDQLLKEAMNASKIIYDQTDKITNSIVASIISILVLIITTVFKSLESVNTVFAFVFIVVFMVFSLVYYFLMRKSSIDRYMLTENQFNHFINEISLLQSEEVSKIKNTYLEMPNQIMISTLKKLKHFLFIVNTIIILLFIYFVLTKYIGSANLQNKVEYLIAKCVS